MAYRCFAYRCKNTNDSEHVIFHQFPNDVKMASDWAQLTGVQKTIDRAKKNLYKRLKLCSDHFSPSQYITNRHLRNNAMPSFVYGRPGQPKRPVQNYDFLTDEIIEISSDSDEGVRNSAEPYLIGTEPCMVNTELCSASTEPGLASTEQCLATTEPCSTSTEPCLASTEQCLASTEPCSTSTEPCSASTEPGLACTEQCLASTEPCSTSTEPCLASTEQYLASTEPCLASTEPCLTSTELSLANTESCLASTEPCRPKPHLLTDEVIVISSDDDESTQNPSKLHLNTKIMSPSLMDQLFPANHKTVFIVDHTPYFGLSSNAHIKMDFAKRPSGTIPPPPIFKSMWTCSIEAVLEYSRIVWDLFPEGKLIRVISSDMQSRNLNSWATSQQNVNHMLHHLSLLGPPTKLVPNTNRDHSIVFGFRAAAEAMIECTTAQLDQGSKKNNIEVQNNCRSIIITSARDDPSIDNLVTMFHNELIKINKYLSQPSSMLIHHCHLVIINTYPDSIICEVTDRPCYKMSTLLDLEVHSVPASKIGMKISNLLLKHYNLASTTVTGIPMKEEQNASSSANYDVEIYHAANAHTTILNASVVDAKAVVAKKEGADYETIKLKWCTPRANNNLPDIHSCTTLHRITPVDINSRPSACLITFLLNGRSVLLEMIKQGGGKSISHVLKSYNGDIYIHTVSSGRTVLEDPPAISEGPGGKVTQYRVSDFGNFMKLNLLQPLKRKQAEDKNCIDDAKERLKKQTAYWPLTTSSTIIFNLKQYTEPMLSLLVKDNMTDQEVMNCKQCIYTLMSAESKNEHLIAPSLTNPRKMMKKEDQYKSMWAELETFLKSNLYTENHCKVLQCLFECRGKPDEEKIIEKTLTRFKKSLAERPSVIRATTDSPMSPPLTQQTGIKHLPRNVDSDPNSVMYLQIVQEHENRKLNPPTRPQFAGRLKSVQMRNGNLFAKLYQHIDDDTDTKNGK